MLFFRFDDLEEFALGVAVARVALANVGEMDVHEVLEVRAGDLLGRPAPVVLMRHYRSIVQGVDLLDEALTVLSPPSPVPRKAACGAAAPVQQVFLLVPAAVFVFVVGDFVGPVPRRGVKDVLKGAEFALREDGEEVVGDVESVGAIEEAEALAEGGGEADVGEGGLVAYKAELGEGEGTGVVGDAVVESASRALGRAGHSRFSPGCLVGISVEARRLRLIRTSTVVETLERCGEGIFGSLCWRPAACKDLSLRYCD